MSDVWAELLDAHETARRLDRGSIPQHKPTAAVLSCSDARVPPSVVFGQAHGDLFDIEGTRGSLDAARFISVGVRLEERRAHSSKRGETACLASPRNRALTLH